MDDVNVYYGQEAVAMVAAREGRPLSYAERLVVHAEGFVDGCYADTKGILTCGVGYTGPYKDMTFTSVFNAHLWLTKSLIDNYDSYSRDLRAQLVVAAYRGDLQQAKKTVELINQGDLRGAAREYLDNEEYRTTPHASIRQRLERLAQALQSE